MGTKAEYPAIIDPKIDPLWPVRFILCPVHCVLFALQCTSAAQFSAIIVLKIDPLSG